MHETTRQARRPCAGRVLHPRKDVAWERLVRSATAPLPFKGDARNFSLAASRNPAW